jgi:hypothetical protein
MKIGRFLDQKGKIYQIFWTKKAKFTAFLNRNDKLDRLLHILDQKNAKFKRFSNQKYQNPNKSLVKKYTFRSKIQITLTFNTKP